VLMMLYELAFFRATGWEARWQRLSSAVRGCCSSSRQRRPERAIDDEAELDTERSPRSSAARR
jgi:hypothetical protein